MLDLKQLQNDFEYVQKALEKKHVDEALLARLRETSLKLKSKRQDLEALQANQNAKSKELGIAARNGLDISKLKEELTNNKAQIATLQESVRSLEESLNKLAFSIPNLPDEDVPEGKDENDNVVLKRVGQKPKFNFTPKEHWDIDSEQNWIDFTRGVKLSKSRFSVLKGEAARLSRALINYMLDFNKKRGFEEVGVP